MKKAIPLQVGKSLLKTGSVSTFFPSYNKMTNSTIKIEMQIPTQLPKIKESEFSDSFFFARLRMYYLFFFEGPLEIST